MQSPSSMMSAATNMNTPQPQQHAIVSSNSSSINVSGNGSMEMDVDPIASDVQGDSVSNLQSCTEQLAAEITNRHNNHSDQIASNQHKSSETRSSDIAISSDGTQSSKSTTELSTLSGGTEPVSIESDPCITLFPSVVSDTIPEDQRQSELTNLQWIHQEHQQNDIHGLSHRHDSDLSDIEQHQFDVDAQSYKLLLNSHLSMIVASYYSDQTGEYTIILNTPKVSQKSYGSEKRFLCPPPMVTLLGTGWDASAAADQSSTSHTETPHEAISTPQPNSSATASRKKCKISQDANKNETPNFGFKVSISMVEDFYELPVASETESVQNLQTTPFENKIVENVEGNMDIDISTMEPSLMNASESSQIERLTSQVASAVEGSMSETTSSSGSGSTSNTSTSSASKESETPKSKNGVKRKHNLNNTGSQNPSDIEKKPMKQSVKKAKIPQKPPMTLSIGELGDLKSDKLRVDLLSKTTKIRDNIDGRDELVNVIRGIFKTLYINDDDKRKLFPLYVRVQSLDDTVLGTFKTESMKVISKPSRKKHARNIDLCIFSGSCISLYNRLRGQTVSTQYLRTSSDGNNLSLSSLEWEPWVIWALDDPRLNPSQLPGESPVTPMKSTTLEHNSVPDTLLLATSSNRKNSKDILTNDTLIEPFRRPGSQSELSFSSGDTFGLGMSNFRWGPGQSSLNHGRPLLYGDSVVLQNCVTGVVTKPLILRSIDAKGNIIHDPNMEGPTPQIRGDAVSQLHKLCLSFLHDTSKYFCTSDSSIRSLYPFETTQSTAKTRAKRTSLILPESTVEQNTSATTESSSNIVIGDGGVWTIIGVDQREYSFWLPPPHLAVPKSILQFQNFEASSERFDPLPVPLVYSVRRTGVNTLQLTGVDFSCRIQCFIGRSLSTHTIFHSSELMDVDISGMGRSRDIAKEAILLVRDDGVIYRTGFYA